MDNGVPLIERIKRLVERQMTILESWTEPPPGADPKEAPGLSADQLDQLKTLALISRQLDLDSVETFNRGGPIADTSGLTPEQLMAQLPGPSKK